MEEINNNPDLGHRRKRSPISSSSPSPEPEPRKRKLSTEPEPRHHHDPEPRRKLSEEPSFTALSAELDRKLHDYLTDSTSYCVSNPIAQVRKAQKAISGFTHVHSPDAEFGKDVSKTDLRQYFEQLVQLDISPTVLRSCNIHKAVKLFSQEFIGNEDADLNLLGCMAHKMQLFWKKLKVTEDLAALSAAAEDQGTTVMSIDDLDVADLDLKKRSWKKLMRALEGKTDLKTAKFTATLLERTQRKKDLSMRGDYHRLINNAVKELTKADAATLEHVIQRLV